MAKLKIPRRTTPAEIRFWRKVEKTGGCWLWIGGKQPSGYGTFTPKTHHVITAHRFSWQLHFGPIPDGLHVCHHCDVRSCVNPAHLFLGTNADNVADMVRKGRQITPLRGIASRGEKNNNAKLTDAKVRAMREWHSHGGVTFRKIAIEYGVTEVAVRYAVIGLTWKHV